MNIQKKAKIKDLDDVFPNVTFVIPIFAIHIILIAINIPVPVHAPLFAFLLVRLHVLVPPSILTSSLVACLVKDKFEICLRIPD